MKTLLITSDSIVEKYRRLVHFFFVGKVVHEMYSVERFEKARKDIENLAKQNRFSTVMSADDINMMGKEGLIDFNNELDSIMQEHLMPMM